MDPELERVKDEVLAKVWPQLSADMDALPPKARLVAAGIVDVLFRTLHVGEPEDQLKALRVFGRLADNFVEAFNAAGAKKKIDPITFEVLPSGLGGDDGTQN